jgi:hypothetical protein
MFNKKMFDKKWRGVNTTVTFSDSEKTFCRRRSRLGRSGSSSTVMNLKWPIRLSHLPRHKPLGFIEMTSMTSPR